MIRTATTTQSPTRASSATAYVVLFALAILQLGVALHHDQHSATDLTNTCVACVQLEQFDDALAASDIDFVIAPDNARAQSATVQRLTGGSARHYQSRAPPALS